MTYAYTDVTAQEIANRALQKSEKKYRRLFDSLSVGVQELDLKTVIPIFNKIEEETPDKISTLIAGNTELIREILRKVEILSANKALLELADVPDLETLQDNIDSFFDNESINTFALLADAIAAKRRQFCSRTCHYILFWKIQIGVGQCNSSKGR